MEKFKKLGERDMVIWKDSIAEYKEYEYDISIERTIIERNKLTGVCTKYPVAIGKEKEAVDEIVTHRSMPVDSIDDYTKKVLKQAYESVTGKKYSEEKVKSIMFVVDGRVMFSWKLTEYEPYAYKIPIKVRYRLKKNFNTHFNGIPYIFTRHTLDVSEEIGCLIKYGYKLTALKEIDLGFLRECLGEDLYDTFIERVEYYNE